MGSRDEQSDDFLNSDTVNDDFFISIVERKLNITRNKFKLHLVLLSPAIANNENHVSIIYRAKIKIEMLGSKERKIVDVIVKVLLKSLVALKSCLFFEKERFMYENIIESFERIWRERGNEEIQFGPKFVKFETDPYEIIVLEDLKASRYEMLDRKVGFSAQQSKIALKKLAKFHAASAIRYQQDGIVETFLDHKLSLVPELMPDKHPFIQGFLNLHQGFIKSLRSYGDCDVYADKVAAWDRQKIMECWMYAAEPMKNGFRVLSHGDLWLNNIMFKFNEDKDPEDVLFLDFQLPVWASPAMDLLFLIVSSVHNDVKIDQFDELTKFYYDELVESLKKLNYDQHIPTYQEFEDDLLEKGHITTTTLIFIMCVTKYDLPEELDVPAAMHGNSEIHHRMYCNETYKKAAKMWLPFLNERGYLDALLPSN